MHVICKRALLIVKPAVGGPIPSNKNSVNITASPAPQEVPDWVKDTDAFRHAAKHKVIKEVVVIDEPEEDDDDEAEADDAGTGAQSGGDVNLLAMTKADLVKYASETFGLELDGASKKDIIAAIQKAAPKAAVAGK
jgi:hypothetical protein